jgi:hypothetical protein
MDAWGFGGDAPSRPTSQGGEIGLDARFIEVIAANEVAVGGQNRDLGAVTGLERRVIGDIDDFDSRSSCWAQELCQLG